MVYHAFGFVAIWQRTLLLPSGGSRDPGMAFAVLPSRRKRRIWNAR